MHEMHRKKRKANIILASILGAFVLLVMIYGMRYVWPHVDIFSK